MRGSWKQIGQRCPAACQTGTESLGKWHSYALTRATPARLNGVPVIRPEEPLGNSHLALMKAHDPPCLQRRRLVDLHEVCCFEPETRSGINVEDSGHAWQG